jgi:hypothetical protein
LWFTTKAVTAYSLDDAMHCIKDSVDFQMMIAEHKFAYLLAHQVEKHFLLLSCVVCISPAT